VRGWLEARRGLVAASVAPRARAGSLPRFVDRRLTESLLTGIIEHLERMQDRTTEEGRGLRAWLEELPERIAQAEGLTPRLLDMVRTAASGRELAHLAARCGRCAGRPDRRCAIAGIEGARDARPHGRAIGGGAGQPVAAAGYERRRRSLPRRERVGLAGADPELSFPIRSRASAARLRPRLELQVGPDLQFIRIKRHRRRFASSASPSIT